MKNNEPFLVGLIVIAITLGLLAIYLTNHDLKEKIKRFDAECQFIGYTIKQDSMGTHYCLRKNGEIIDTLRQDGSKVGDE